MKYWICKKCKTIHKMSTIHCECGMPLEAMILLNPQILEFPTENDLKKWLETMKRYAGATLKLGRELR